MLQERQSHHYVRGPLAARRVCDFAHVLDQAGDAEKLRHRSHFSGFLINHHSGADTTVRMTTAGHLAPLCIWSMHQIGKVGKGAHQRQRKPITSWFGNPNLILNIVRQVRKRVALLQTTLFRDFFIATREGNRLEGKKCNLFGVVECKPYYRTDLIVINSVDQRGDENDLDSGLMQVVNCPEFYVKKISDLT